MTYGQKLEELKKNAAKKLEIRTQIDTGFTNEGKYSRMQLDKADYDHKCAINDFKELQLLMQSNGFSESDEIDG